MGDNMAAGQIAAAWRRVESVLQRRPEAGLHDDAPATVRWQGALRMVASHANGVQVTTDMAQEFGGSGDQVTPGWLFRAALASCAATCIAMAAAAEGVELTVLEVHTTSRSDLRGLFGMSNADGEPVSAGPSELRLDVRIAARGVAPERLRAMVEQSCRQSPVPSLVRQPMPIALHVDVEAG